MISAMPAVAVRQERRKNKSYDGGRGRAHSLPAVSSPNLDVHYKKTPRKTCQIDQQKLKLLIYVGTVLLVAGLVLVFIGVGTGVSTFQTIGLVFIGIGVLFCFVNVFMSEQQSTLLKRPKLTNAAKDSLCAVIVAPTTTTSSGGEAANLKSSTTQTPPLSPTEECGATKRSNQSSSLSPTSLSSIPETQVLIVGREKRDRF